MKRSFSDMNCDQCYLDSGIKVKNKKTFSLAEVHEATHSIVLNGAKIKLCDIHFKKMDKLCEKKQIKFTARIIKE